MAQTDQRLPQNVEGEFFVDSTCIDCDACRQIAPASFRDHGGQSSVYRQPQNPCELHRALMALVACPRRRSEQLPGAAPARASKHFLCTLWMKFISAASRRNQVSARGRT